MQAGLPAVLREAMQAGSSLAAQPPSTLPLACGLLRGILC